MARPLRISCPGAFYHVTSGTMSKRVYSRVIKIEKLLEYFETGVKINNADAASSNKSKEIFLTLNHTKNAKMRGKLIDIQYENPLKNIEGPTILRYILRLKERWCVRPAGGLPVKF